MGVAGISSSQADHGAAASSPGEGVAAQPPASTDPPGGFRIPFSRGLAVSLDLANIAALVVLGFAGVMLAIYAKVAFSGALRFDDAYMFYRYAMNIRHGLGIAWNPDGLATYGMTSQIWVFCVLPLTWLPLSPGHILQLASGLAGLAALGLVVWVTRRHAPSALLRSTVVAAAISLAPLLVFPSFGTHLFNGMDTMLSFLTNGLVVLAVLDYLERPSLRRAVAGGILAFLAFLARPENALPALLALSLAWLTGPRIARRFDVAGLILLPVILIGGDLLACRLYFGTALPLSFYAKVAHAYAGRMNPENAVEYLSVFAGYALFFAALIAANLTRSRLRLVLVFLPPLLLSLVCLTGVQQIMGYYGRYFVPLLPYLIVPAVLLADAAWLGDPRRMAFRTIAACAVAIVLAVASAPAWSLAAKFYSQHLAQQPIALPALPTAARTPLPQHDGLRLRTLLADAVISRLPSGATAAASEIGYLAAVSPQVTVIDLAGLNDTTIGTQGFSMDYLLARSPDVIWFPHTDYTGLRALMFGDPRLFERYTVIDGAFGYGIAISKTGPYRRDVEAAVRRAWADLYPQQTFEDYVVRARR